MQKVVLLIAYLRSAESKPSILDDKLYYYGDADQNSFYSVTHALIKGQTYPVRDLLSDMITKSGNDSTRVLFDNVDKNELVRVYDDLMFPMPEDSKPELISVKVYSRLFRVLYSSTFLDRDLSEGVLSLLSRTEFDDGLKAFLPKDTKIAHKFGEITVKRADGNLERQLHDCGIIYYPDHPYFLCVMTKGKEFSELEKIISEISKITYDYWSSVN